MPTSEGFVEFVLDQLRGIDGVSARRMFGGVGIYAGDSFFGIIFRDVVYLKVDDTNRKDYLKARSKPFRPYANRPTTMQYFAVPLAVLEDADEFARWAERAVAASRRSPGRKSTKRRTKPD